MRPHMSIFCVTPSDKVRHSFEASHFCSVETQKDRNCLYSCQSQIISIRLVHGTLLLHSFYTWSPRTDLETHRWGLLHVLDRHLVANECPDVVDSVPMGGEVPVLNVRAWAE